ncbi:MAG: hypothetical protein Q7J43_10630 [Pseudomonas sp.]|uniref:hypothetical protein n=1 Tax=Pseudomonas sp. TaxID=306 RepID=UPI00272860B7|nr:hypothetical protein [Pseudomonas sp.]MDO9618122.1 hypothetical protein [Pseudomonas sp.]MDP2447869.1 hypothetical protein [Pseudomonas sp.]
MIALLAYPSMLFLCSACTVQPQKEKPSLQLQNLTYADALQAYRSTPRNENYRCTHQLADDNYTASADAKVVAVEIDDALYLRQDELLLELGQTQFSEKAARYENSISQIEAGYSIIKQFNFSEYNESDDRHVDLWVKTPKGTQHVKTFGHRCGI